MRKAYPDIIKALQTTRGEESEELVKELTWSKAMRLAESGVRITATDQSAVGLQKRSEKLQRKKLWQIRGMYHCSVIGTCLSLATLRKLSSKVGVSLSDNPTDIELHQQFLRLAGDSGRRGKLLNKTLDRKYAASIKRFAEAQDTDDLERLWEKSLKAGNIPGPYWAVMTHPLATYDVIGRAFGEVHMLSHLVGASNRAAIKQLRALEQKTVDLEEGYSAKLYKFKKMLEGRDNQIQALTRHLRLAREKNKKTEELYNQIRRLEKGEKIQDLEKRIEDLEKKLEILERENLDLLEREKDLLKSLESSEKECQSLMRIDCVQDEAIRELERALDIRDLKEFRANCEDFQTDRCPGPKLCGKRILYLGGRKNLVIRYRSVIELIGGEFLYHDGGIEDSSGCLTGTLEKADIVLCPTDCVSHEACLKAKKACKNSMKAFVPLRSAGLSTLAEYFGQNSFKVNGV